MTDVERSAAPEVYHQLGEAAAEIERAFENGEKPDFEELATRYPGKLSELKALAATIEALYSFEITERLSDDSQKPMHGRELGDFQLIQEIGRGGMGVVYEARQLSLDRRVAVKILPLAGLLDKRQLERFRNEARAAAMLRHPNIVDVHTVGCERGVHFYAMSLIDGRSLAEVLDSDKSANRSSKLASEETSPVANLSTASLSSRSNLASRPRFRGMVGVVEKAARALHYAHEEGVLHRDVKPSNLLLDDDGQIHVTDFGLARILSQEHLTMSGDIVGTLRYMSPQQIEGSSADRRGDIYGLGLVLYEMLVGEPAFNEPKRAVLIRKILEDEVPAPSRKNRHIPADLDRIVLKATAKASHERYATAEDFADDLARYLDGRPVKARGLTTLHRAWRWSLRNRSKAALIALLTTLLLGFGIGGSLAALSYSKLAEEQAHELYERQMATAHDLIENGKIERAVNLLRTFLPQDGERDYRSFEWFEMVRRCKRRLEANTFETVFPNRVVATSSSGELLVGSRVAGISLIHPSTGIDRWSLSQRGGSLAYVKGVGFTAYEEAVVTASASNLALRSRRDGRLLIDLIEFGTQPTGMDMTEGGLIAVGLAPKQQLLKESEVPAEKRFSTIALFELKKTEGVFSLTKVDELPDIPGDTHRMAFSPSGELLAVIGRDSMVRIWNVKQRTFKQSLEANHSVLNDVAFAPDGSRICGVGGQFDGGRWLSGGATVWHLATEEIVEEFTHEEAFNAVEFTNDQMLAVGTRQGKVIFRDIQNRREVETVLAHSNLINDLEMTRDGNFVVSASEDNSVRIWSIPTEPELDLLEIPGEMQSVMGIDISPDGKSLASVSGDGGIRLWDTRTGSLISHLGDHDSRIALAIDYSPDGKKLASLGDDDITAKKRRQSELLLWDLGPDERTDPKVFKLPLHTLPASRSCAFSRNSEHLAIANYAGTKGLTLWNIKEERIDQHAPIEWGYRVAFSDNGDHLATPAGVWTYPELKQVRHHDESVRAFAIAFHPDNDTYAHGHPHDGFFLSSIRDTDRTEHFPLGEIILHAEFSRDLKRLFLGTQHGDVIVWNTATKREVIRYRDHDFWVWCLAESDDGTTLASSSGGTKHLMPRIALRRALSDAEAREVLEKR